MFSISMRQRTHLLHKCIIIYIIHLWHLGLIQCPLHIYFNKHHARTQTVKIQNLSIICIWAYFTAPSSPSIHIHDSDLLLPKHRFQFVCMFGPIEVKAPGKFMREGVGCFFIWDRKGQHSITKTETGVTTFILSITINSF